MYAEDSLDEDLAIMEERSITRAAVTSDALGAPLDELVHHDAIRVSQTTTLAEVLGMMRTRHMGAAMVTDPLGRLSGIFTERDIMLKMAGRTDLNYESPVAWMMTPDPERLRLGDPLVFVMNMMHIGGFRHVPIVDSEDAPIGMISMRDVMAFFLDAFDREISTIPPEPSRGAAPRYGG